MVSLPLDCFTALKHTVSIEENSMDYRFSRHTRRQKFRLLISLVKNPPPRKTSFRLQSPSIAILAATVLAMPCRKNAPKAVEKYRQKLKNPNNINKFFKGLPRPKTRADLDGPNNNHDDANSRWPRRHSAIAGRMKATSERKHAGLPHVPPPLSIMPSCPVSCPRAPKAHWQVVSRFPAMAAVF